MECTYLGRTGLQVSRLCLGTMNFGWYTPQEESFGIMDRALELGINFFDTANMYGGPDGKGKTEEILGRWLAQGGERRERIVLASKVYARMGDWPNQSRLSAYHIRQACEDSLRRLGIDRIDLYQMHHIDRNTPWEEIWQAMEQLVREGKVLYVGSSNFPAWGIAKANGLAERRNFLGLVSEQSIYSLRNRHIELEVIPACREFGLGLIPWSPLAGGLLCGILEKRKEGRRTREPLVEAAEKLRPQLEAYEGLCEEIGHRPADVALAWILGRPQVTSPIVGPRTIEQLDQNAACLEISLDETTRKRLDEIWPGPGGEAPEAYAW
jgi:aryl-alcohol dehydrogenase-like predicted oxidoreductase